MAERTDLFRSDVVRGADIQVERKKEIIKGFAVVTKGTTHDERGEFDETALDTIVELGNKAKLGVKSRFGHPNMSNTALGTFLGRVKKFRRDADIVRADLYIDQTAHKTPDGDLADYVIDLAESDPQAFGSSMVIYWDEELRVDEQGKPLKDEQGKDLPPLIRVRKLSSVDIVDDPAANNGLFGVPFFSKGVMPSLEMTAFLDRFLAQPEAVEKVISFLERYRVNRQEIEKNTLKKGGKTMFENLTVDQLKKERQDLFEAVQKLGLDEGKKQGTDEGQKLERERVVSILKEAKNFHEMTELAQEAVEKGLSLNQAIIAFQKKQLNGIQNAHAQGPGPDKDDSSPEKKSHLERAEAYKEEHKCSMTQALQATAEKRS